MSNFDIYVERVLKHEGGYVNHPNDPGGETNLGITWPTLNKAVEDRIIPPGYTIKSLPRDLVRIIYYEYYYKPWLWIESDALRFQVFDAYVNHRPTSVISMLQRALGVSADGELGPVTKGAYDVVTLQEEVRLVFKFMSERQFHFLKQPAKGTFGKGWMARMAENMRYAAEDL